MFFDIVSGERLQVLLWLLLSLLPDHEGGQLNLDPEHDRVGRQDEGRIRCPAGSG